MTLKYLVSIVSYWVLLLLFTFQLLAPQYNCKSRLVLKRAVCFFIVMVYIANNNLIFRMNHNRMGEDKGGSLVSKNIKKDLL